MYPDDVEIVENKKNNNAIVCKVIWKNISMLFTGDIEKEAEEKVINMYNKNLEKLKSTIIKVAHHGSKTSSTEEFLNIVKPEIALIGVGENNKFGHPNEEVLERLRLMRTKIFRTDNSGEITIRFNKNKKINITKMIKQGG